MTTFSSAWRNNTLDSPDARVPGRWSAGTTTRVINVSLVDVDGGHELAHLESELQKLQEEMANLIVKQDQAAASREYEVLVTLQLRARQVQIEIDDIVSQSARKVRAAQGAWSNVSHTTKRVASNVVTVVHTMPGTRSLPFSRVFPDSVRS